MITDCKERISNIEIVLRQYDDKYESMGLNNGLLGLSAFCYYCFIYTKNAKYLEDISNYISRSFAGLDQNYTGFSSVGDIMEIGIYLHFLKRKGILEDNVNDYLEQADTIVQDFLKIQITDKNIDPLSGMISVGYYLLNRLDTKDVIKEIEKIVYEIEKLAIVKAESEEIYWYNNFRDKDMLELQLGYTHGIAGIVNFILSVYEKGILQTRCRRLIVSALKFLAKHKTLEGINLFPFEALNSTSIDYQNLCYGDLGIGYVFLRAGKILLHEDFLKIGIEIIENSACFRDDKNEYIQDANLLYGASGLFSFFNAMSKYIDRKVIQKACDYWFGKIMSHNKHATPWVGYNSNFNNHLESTQICFSEGICGIGITLMASELKIEEDYLTFMNYSF